MAQGQRCRERVQIQWHEGKRCHERCKSREGSDARSGANPVARGQRCQERVQIQWREIKRCRERVQIQWREDSDAGSACKSSGARAAMPGAVQIA